MVLLYNTSEKLVQCCISYRNQSFDFPFKINGWFLYEIQHGTEVD